MVALGRGGEGQIRNQFGYQLGEEQIKGRGNHDGSLMLVDHMIQCSLVN